MQGTAYRWDGGTARGFVLWLQCVFHSVTKQNNGKDMFSDHGCLLLNK